jgi:hypothetical protein
MITRKPGNSVAAILFLLFTASSALAGSVTQPGDTMGFASGAPTPPGVIFTNQANAGCSNTTPRTCFWTEVPLLAVSTPWKILGGQLLFAMGPTTWVDVDIHNAYQASGWFNPFFGAKLAWDLGHGWSVSYMLGGYLDVHSQLAYSSSSLNQRFALSYTANEWNLTANAIWGINLDQATTRPQGTPCPTQPTLGCNPNFLNVDLTATKRFGKWEFGAIGYYASDISTPVFDYARQSKAAVGALVGYSFGPAALQVYVTTDVYEKNYGGKDTRFWTRLNVPLGNPFGKPAAPATRPIAH